MDQFLITGYSAKLDNIVYVIRGEDLKDAFVKLAESTNGKYLCIKTHSADEEDEWDIIMYDGRATDEDIKTMLTNEGDLRLSGFVVYGQKVVEGENLAEVICW